VVAECKLRWDNLYSVRSETSREFRKKKTQYTEEKNNEFETNNKNKHRDINEFEEGYNLERN
jgi:hypothetical protein